MKNRSRRCAAALSVALLVGSYAPSLAPAAPARLGGSWVASGARWWYRRADGSYPASEWLADAGCWFWFDGDGWMATGWRLVNGSWYYFDPNGAMATGWRFVNGNWYYFDPNGVMATGWRLVNGNWYYLHGSGAMAANEQVGGWYCGPSGAAYEVGSGDWVGTWRTSGGDLRGITIELRANGTFVDHADGADHTGTWHTVYEGKQCQLYFDKGDTWLISPKGSGYEVRVQAPREARGLMSPIYRG